MLKHFRIVPFLAGIVIGILAIYYVKPEREVVMKYPKPDEVERLVYKDKNGVCYKYRVREVDCDANEARLKAFPLN